MMGYFARHPVAANILMAALVILGLSALPDLLRETFPRIPAKEVEVTVPYPGATAEEVEETLCLRLEDALDGIENMLELRCEARDSVAMATAEMTEGNDLIRFLDDIKTEVDAIDSFPEDVETPTVTDLGRTDFVASLAVTGPMPLLDLKTYAEDLRDRLKQVPDISLVELRGFSDLQVRIELPASTLRQYGLSVEAVAQQIGRQSIGRPAGTLETADGDVILRFDAERKRARDFADVVVISGSAGGEILLGDIAILSEQAEAAEEKVLYNGQRAAQLDIIKTQDQDSLEVMASLRAFLETEAQQAPPGVTVAITADLTSITSDRLNMLVENGLQGLVLVFLVMWLFFNLRYSLWITLGLPISFLGALFLMAHLGYSLNMITMVALIIAIGLLMDDAIVISENVHSQLKRGLSPIEAAIHGTRQVAPGVISSFLTTILIFGSLAFMGGDMGAVLKVLPVVLILVLAVSLIEAFLVLPNHLAHSLTDKDIHTRPESFRARFERGFDVLRLHLFGRLLDRAIRWRYLTLGILLSLVLLSISLAAGGVLKFRAFPDLDGNVVEARLLLPQGTPLTRTEELVGRLVEAAKQVNAEQIDQQPDGQDLIIAISERYAVNSDASESGPHVATVTLDLLSSEIRNGSTDDVIARWRDLVGPLPDVVFLKFTERQLGPGGKDIELRLVGQDLDALKQASNELIGWLGRYEGAHDLFDDLRPGKPELRVHLKDGAGAIGITAQTISDQLRAAFQGMTVSEVQSGPNAFEIDVRLSEQDRDSLGDLDDFTIVAPSGALVPLSAIAELDYGRGYARIARVNGQRVVTIEGSVDSSRANAAQIIAHTQTHFLPGFLERHPDVALNLKGQAEETSKTSSSLMRNFSLGLIGVFLLLTFQFRNYVEPVLVLTAIPMGLIGAFFGHVAQGLELSMPSIVGFASLAGVVVNDTILLVQFIKMRRALGDSAEDAARKAGRGRFRAILLTSVTTIAGLTPLLLETSLQAQVMIPLATSLAFGLLSATVLSLFFVPCFYLVLDDFGLSAKVGEEDKALAAEGLDNEPLDDPRP